jgi:surface antigen
MACDSFTNRQLALKWKAVAFLSLTALAVPVPASAQFGGLFKQPSGTSDTDKSRCDETAASSAGRSIMGGMLRNFAGRATRGMGVVGSFIPSDAVAGILTDAIACRLDPQEQQQAADATLEVTRSEEAGATAEWTSETRKNVSGRSTVTQKTALADGRSCMSITDVVIVEGEETSVSKQMCRAPGETRYTILV